MKHCAPYIWLLFFAWPAPAVAEVIQTWDFTQETLGWTANASIANFQSTAEGLDFDCTAVDPNVTGPAVDYGGASTAQVVIRMRSNAADGRGKLFYGTSFNEANSRAFTVTTDNLWHEYTVDIPALAAGARLRLDPCDGTGHVTVAWIEVRGTAGMPTELRLDNGTIIIGMNTAQYGGAITYLSLSGANRNLINIHDRGREIQQSYYAGQSLDRRAEGQSANWSPWPWNPIQVGDAFGHSSEVLEARIEGGVAYTKTIPLLWDMNNEPGKCIMEQRTSLDGNVVHVHNKLTCSRDPGDIWTETISRSQELPAVYTIADCYRLFTYVGDAPWTGEALTRIINNPNDGFIWDAFTATERWAANVDDSGFGVGVYNKLTASFIGGLAGSPYGGPNDGSTAYISPIRNAVLARDSVYEYDYDLIVGTLEQIRQYVYDHPPDNKFGAEYWKFDTDGDFEDWSSNSGVTGAEVSGGWLRFDVSGSDPIWNSPTTIIAAGMNHYLHVRLKNGTAGTTAQLFWANAAGGFAAARSVTIPITANDTAPKDYVVDLAADPDWTGTITRVRFDPVPSQAGHYEIDYIAICANPDTPELSATRAPWALFR
ncbi:MAG: hypothetical protein M1457_00370 [bacterium]|nr:hypothetical protein [bacterium]